MSGVMSHVTLTSTKGAEPSRSRGKKGGFFNSPHVKIPTERGGETHRERARVQIRDEFMSQMGIDRQTFEKDYGEGKGYSKVWRPFAEERGLHLPA